MQRVNKRQRKYKNEKILKFANLTHNFKSSNLNAYIDFKRKKLFQICHISLQLEQL